MKGSKNYTRVAADEIGAGEVRADVITADGSAQTGQSIRVLRADGSEHTGSQSRQVVRADESKQTGQADGSSRRVTADDLGEPTVSVKQEKCAP